MDSLRAFASRLDTMGSHVQSPEVRRADGFGEVFRVLTATCFRADLRVIRLSGVRGSTTLCPSSSVNSSTVSEFSGLRGVSRDGAQIDSFTVQSHLAAADA
jgi:hypothetical protein